ncbi:MAG: MurR/RpiR family transcriptional regulator [Paracoccaceae bacterium]
MTEPTTTIAEKLQSKFDSLTRAERQLTNSLLDNYPVSGLASITTVAQNADVSTPTVARMVQKLGFKGYSEFQRALRGELEARISNPIAKHDNWAATAPETHVLNRFTEAVIENMRQTLGQIDPEKFDDACTMLADPERSVSIVGGRITRALADYMFTHLQVAREGVGLIPPNSNTWPHYVLDMKAGDVLVVFDIRRYEHDILRLAQLAKERGAEIILFTDQWSSPVSKIATHRFNCRIEVPSAWDSSTTTMLIVETVIASVQDLTWDGTSDRMEKLEELFDRTKLFRKFI